MKCKFPDKPCTDRYRSENHKKAGLNCRLAEWKLRIKTCPYEKTIASPFRHSQRRDPCQKLLT